MSVMHGGKAAITDVGVKLVVCYYHVLYVAVSFVLSAGLQEEVWLGLVCALLNRAAAWFYLVGLSWQVFQ